MLILRIATTDSVASAPPNLVTDADNLEPRPSQGCASNRALNGVIGLRKRHPYRQHKS